HRDEQRCVAAKRVHGEVDLADWTIDPQHAQERPQPLEQRTETSREEDDAGNPGGDDERELDPEVPADVVMANGEREPGGGEDERRQRPLHATASTRLVTKRISPAARSAIASASSGVSPVARIAPARSEARRSRRKTWPLFR